MRAVDAQEADPQSLLHHTRAMLALRNSRPALRYGAVTACKADGDLLILDREASGDRVRVVANFGRETIELNEQQGAGEVLAAINGATSGMLPPFGALVLAR